MKIDKKDKVLKIKENKELKIKENKKDPKPSKKQDADSGADKTVENTLVALYKLQTIYSRIDKVRMVRGELPLEVSDLEDECLGLQTRIDKFEEIVKDYQSQILDRQEQMKKSQAQITKYKEQLDNVRNNREYEALGKEIEYEDLEIQLCEKKIREFTATIEDKKTEIEELNTELERTKIELNSKKEELSTIVSETEKEEKDLLKQSKKQEAQVETHRLNAFTRIRTSMRNGLATVKVDRNACGGCFSKISPQRQLDIRMHKKIIVCEFCGRILIDDEIAAMAAVK